MYRVLFDFVKRRVPRISDTELVALRSGNTSLDRDILCGRIAYPSKPNISHNKISDSMLPELFRNFDGKPLYPGDGKWIDYLSKNKYFSFLIDEKYGGVKLSVNELSNVLTKITSVDPALGVVAMVASASLA